MSLKDPMGVKENANKIWSGFKGLFNAAVGLYIAAVPVHDIWTGESLLSKTWNSTVVAAMDDTDTCKQDALLDGSFICERRGDGKGLGSLIPGFLK